MFSASQPSPHQTPVSFDRPLLRPMTHDSWTVADASGTSPSWYDVAGGIAGTRVSKEMLLFHSICHEIGHAGGLSHPRNYDAIGNEIVNTRGFPLINRYDEVERLMHFSMLRIGSTTENYNWRLNAAEISRLRQAYLHHPIQEVYQDAP